jgi:hypothetical protein
VIRMRGPERKIDRLACLIVSLLVASSFLLIASSYTVTEAVLSLFPKYAPVLRLFPRYKGEQGTPDFGRLEAQIDVAEIRRAADILPDDALYYVHAPERFAKDVRRVAQFYFLPAAAVRHPTGADWVLAFRSPSLPQGLVERESIALSPDLSLIRVARD